VAADRERRPYRKGVGIVLVNRQGLVFAGRRLDASLEAWQMPQGGLAEGEAPGAAALRELEEEIGTANVEVLAEARDWLAYDLPPELREAVWGGRYRGQRQKWFAMRFLGEDREIDVATAHPEFAAWRWLRPAELLRAIVPFKRALYERVFDEFRAFLAP
jgi:putative (di)nucleoside polyphosphate hydrolase